jgi:hypothetical protein
MAREGGGVVEMEVVVEEEEEEVEVVVVAHAHAITRSITRRPRHGVAGYLAEY